MNRLTHSQYQATFGEGMTRQELDQAPPVDFWPYVDDIPESDLQGHSIGDGTVGSGYRSETEDYGHFLLHLNREYSCPVVGSTEI